MTEKEPYNVLSTEAYIIYLRKSRTDDPNESVEEVLAKHEAELQEMAVREFGGRIPESCIYREIVSGETIDERPEMKKVLAAIENPAVKMVLVVEPSRLSRGDLEDCGRIVNALRYTSTKVLTRQMEYDLSNKMHRKFFEQELMRGNDFLEFTKEILLAGRIRSVKSGNYIGNTAPLGYDKAEIDGCPSLKPNEDADIIRMIFDMYVNGGKTYLQIARHLDSIGFKPMHSKIWEKSSIRFILQNVHYAGYVRFGWKRTEKVVENGQVVKKRGIPVAKEETITARGKHQALVSQELFDAAQEIMNNNPRAKQGFPLKNPLAGVFFCSKCGRAMAQHPYKHARDRYECRNRGGCGSKSAPMDEVLEAVALALENEMLPDLEVKLKNNDGSSAMIQQKQLERMQAQLEELREQEQNQYELVEKKIYSEELFVRRNRELHAEMDELKSRIYEAKQYLPKEIDYAEKIVKLKDAIAALRDDSIPAETKNKLIKSIVERIDYEFLSYKGKGQTRYRLHIKLLL